MHLTARQSVISLLEKAGNPLKLTCWRPLSLLNTDQKIFGKILAKRLDVVLDELIHHSQQGFLKNRHMSENILKIQKILQYCEKEGKDGLLISFDYEKAFDTLEWETIFTALEAFNLGPGYIGMVKTLFSNPIAYTMNNGFWSEPIYPTRGTRQGCCFSPKIFVLTVELLGLGIRQNDDIIGIDINGSVIKSGQFADDLWTVTPASKQNVDNILRELLAFQSFSGLRINMEKCAILKIGPFWKSDAKFYTMKQSEGPVKILGYWIHPDKQTMYEYNFEKTLEKVNTIMKSWKDRNVTIFGKVTIVNTLINSLSAHKLMALPTPPKSFFVKYKTKIIEF